MDKNQPNRIKELRTELGMTQAELAEKIGVNSITLSRYENNLRNPKIDKLIAMSELFSVPVEYITGESDSREFTLSAAIKQIESKLENGEKIINGSMRVEFPSEMETMTYEYLTENIQAIINILIPYILSETDNSKIVGQTILDFLKTMMKAIQKDDDEKIKFINHITNNLFNQRGLASDGFLNIPRVEEKEDGSRRGYLGKVSKDDTLELLKLYKSKASKLDEIQFNYFMSIIEKLEN